MSETPEENTKVTACVSEYASVRPFYEKLVKEVKYVLNEKLKLADVKVADVSGRAKTPERFKEKIERKRYKTPLMDITDLAGVRVVCYYEPDLATVNDIIRSAFQVHEHIDKNDDLGVDKMGYHGTHFVIALGSLYSGARYDDITDLRCEIQVRTVLQDAWALFSHHLVYKDEASIPERMRRDLNNVASLLEIAQGVFDSIRDKRGMYLNEIRRKEEDVPEFLAQPIDYDTLAAYTEWKFPELGISEHWHTRLLADLNRDRYLTLKDIDEVVDRAKPAVDAYQEENPTWFKAGTAYLTKSLGFVDSDFRQKHRWGDQTKEAFRRLGHLTKKTKTTEQTN